ncbi:hypothetical protein [Achromobacter insolitus]|uniref:hypothetical protein n=1 Tax=Achromobacter insolitus TaxID=217204 RepID=UPI0027E13A61|nr:hypothetical protein [Achromobacter insolitus]MDQ6212126.1 hypothetical protein [Achromobacter insolitus]
MQPFFGAEIDPKRKFKGQKKTTAFKEEWPFAQARRRRRRAKRAIQMPGLAATVETIDSN